MPKLRSADRLLLPAVEEAIDAAKIDAADVGVAQLARTLARTIDGMSDDQRARMLGQTGPALFRVLEALSGRARARTGVPASGRLAMLRETRRLSGAS